MELYDTGDNVVKCTQNVVRCHTLFHCEVRVVCAQVYGHEDDVDFDGTQVKQSDLLVL